jgi:hypothetical protein
MRFTFPEEVMGWQIKSLRRIFVFWRDVRRSKVRSKKRSKKLIEGDL